MSTKTPDEVDALKLNWIKDPCWDIEKTEGFEEHEAELLEFRHKIEKDAQAKIDKANKVKQDWIGDHDPINLVNAVTLPQDIASILDRLDQSVGDCGSAAAYADFIIKRAQVKTNLLIAIQLKRIAQALEAAQGNDTYNAMIDLYRIK